MTICTDCAGEVEAAEMDRHMRVAHGVNYRRPEPADTIVEAVARTGRECEACAKGEPCERLQKLVAAAWQLEKPS